MMADQESSEEASNPDTSSELVELKIKTLDSQIFSFQVDKDMPVSLFKEKVASDIGVPVGQQRLICRGKLLKDDHLLSEYHVENGHTLHLVERQPSQPHLSTDGSAGETNGCSGAQASDANVGTPRNHVGQIPHGIVLGTLNAGDQSESVVPDLAQVIGAVLNSFGVTGQPFVNTTISSPNGQGNEADFMHVGNHTQPNPGQPFPFPPQLIQIPLTTAATTIPLPSLTSPIPDCLNTLLEYMNRMERALSQYGFLQNMSSIDSSDLNRVELPSYTRGLPSPEALVIVMRRAEQLLSSHAIATLSHFAASLEQERDSSDSSVRGQMQTEIVQVGLAMQHFGALLLELGRTILTLHMGESPVQLESYLNVGPAVYISPSGPNPIMVQPFPLQTNSLFVGANAPSSPITLGPVGIGSAPRHINIHIHAVPVVSALSNGARNGEGTQGEQSAFTSPVSSSSSRVSPARNIIRATMPPRPGPTTITNTTHPNGTVSSSQVLSELSLSSLLAELNSRVRNLAGNVQGENQVASDDTQPTYINRSIDPIVSGFMPPSGNLKDSFRGGGSASSRGTALRDENVNASPLGLGMGGLERKRMGDKHTKSSTTSDHNMSNLDRDLDAASSQHLFQSLATRGSSMNKMDGISTSSSGHTIGNIRPSRAQGAADQFDVANVASQLFENPTLMNSLLGGVSAQADFGSSDMLGNLMQQFTQNPQIMNVVGQFAQQADGREHGSMFSQLGSGRGEGVDLSHMVQQMMPIVSQALSRGSNSSEPQSNSQYDGKRSSPTDKYNDKHFQIDIQQLAQSVHEFTSPVDVFHAVAENAVQVLADDETCAEELLVEVCNDEDLANDYVRMLQRDIHQQFQDIA